MTSFLCHCKDGEAERGKLGTPLWSGSDRVTLMEGLYAWLFQRDSAGVWKFPGGSRTAPTKLAQRRCSRTKPSEFLLEALRLVRDDHEPAVVHGRDGAVEKVQLRSLR